MAGVWEVTDMADKQIIQLTTETGQLNSDSWFVFQNTLNQVDLKVKLSGIAAYLSQIGAGDFNIFGGTITPNNALGSPRDLYFKANGAIYKKIGSSWVKQVNATSIEVITKTFAASSVGPYVLTAPELAKVNEVAKYPNFVALIGGTPFPDIQPTYTGSPGSFTQIRIELHGDPTPETVTVQFS